MADSMDRDLPPCWEIMACGLEPGGARADALGVCPAAAENMGHSCWVVAGTLCRGEVQGEFARKMQTCVACEVYRRYGRVSGPDGRAVAERFRDEQARYLEIVLARSHDDDPGD